METFKTCSNPGNLQAEAKRYQIMSKKRWTFCSANSVADPGSGPFLTLGYIWIPICR
jgi:hypothetical protein